MEKSDQLEEDQRELSLVIDGSGSGSGNEYDMSLELESKENDSFQEVY